MISNVKVPPLIALIPLAAVAATVHQGSADVAEIVSNSFYSERDDHLLAQELGKVRLSEQLNPHVITYFQNARVGPEAIAALRKLQDQSAMLPSPGEAPISIGPIPIQDDQLAVLRRTFHYAQSYVKSLPNFLCTQTTRRYINIGSGLGGIPSYIKTLRHSDDMTWTLRFVDGVEDGNVLQRGGSGLKRSIAHKPQSLSSGEFGTDMTAIFGTGIEPQITWDHWEMFRGRRTAVFKYAAGKSDPRFTIMWFNIRPVAGEARQTVKVPIRGLFFVDFNTGIISRLMIEATDLPTDFHVRESRTIIDYGSVPIGGKTYKLPLTASVFISSDLQKNLNKIAFTDYRKFEAESVFTYSESTITYKTSKASK